MARVYPTTVIALVVVSVVLYMLVFRLQKPGDNSNDNTKGGQNNRPHVERRPIFLAGDSTLKNLTKSYSKSAARKDAPTVKPPSSGDQPKVNVLVCSDEKTLGGLIAAVNSIRLNTKAHVTFHLVVDEQSLVHLRTWLAVPSLRDLDYTMVAFNESTITSKYSGKDSRKETVSPFSYARFYFPRMFPTLTGRLVFVDSDTIVQGDIAELNDVKMDGGTAVALSDDCSSVSNRATLHLSAYSSYLNFNNDKVKKLAINPMACSFSAGVFVANVSLWKEQKITEKVDYWLSQNAKYDVWGTQRSVGNVAPPLMIVLYKQHNDIPPEWHVRHLGVTSGTRYSENFVKSAKLLHWNGHFKPWGRTSQHTLVWEKYFVPDPTKKFRLVRKYLLN